MKWNALARSLVRLCILSLISWLLFGCQSLKTWKYTSQHRGIYTIVYNPTNLPIENIDLDALRATAKKTFGPDDQPAVVIVGYPDDRKLKLRNLDTSKVFQTKRGYFSTPVSIAIGPLNIRQTGNYEIYFHELFESRDAFDFSVMRTPAQLAGANTIEPFGWIQLSLKPGSVVKNYGAVFQTLVQREWFRLISSTNVPLSRGAVILDFRLTEQGQITDMKVVKSTVNVYWSTLCEKAVSNPAPYRPWPEEMRRKLSKKYQQIRFTFRYR